MIWILIDIDECDVSYLHNCDESADCENTDGSFVCTCKPGYTDMGNGTICSGKPYTCNMHVYMHIFS